jgi:hypothetical protein
MWQLKKIMPVLSHFVNTQQEPDEILRDDLLQLEYGNKIAILGGDYLLANACTGLADLRNTYIVEMISIAIAEFTQVSRDAEIIRRVCGLLFLTSVVFP